MTSVSKSSAVMGGLMIRYLFLWVLVTIFSALAPEARAWGPDGHKIVCYIADELLSDEEQTKLRGMIRSYNFENQKYRYYSSSCNFADVARFKARDYEKALKRGNHQEAEELKPWYDAFSTIEDWHYINVERTDTKIDKSDCPKIEGCLLKGIDTHSKKMRASTSSTRAEAAMLLGHWVGDLHQPLHVSYEDDYGGGGIKVKGNLYGYETNLHSVWDSGIINIIKRRDNMDWMGLAKRLKHEITDEDMTKWSLGAPVDWSQESFELARLKNTKYCRLKNSGLCQSRGRKLTLTKSYQQRNEAIIEMRLKQAGVRLASLLKQELN